jgi:NAD-dependent SIR2 family protein deacetylase
LDEIAELMQGRRTVVLSGAGVSTGSGIPDYRDQHGDWKRRPPVQHQDFVRYASTRRRYWARSLIGWPRVADAAPNDAHRALSRIERAGFVHVTITQNVDGLHQRAGSRQVIDLHGRLDGIVCLGCKRRADRGALQAELAARNPRFAALSAETAPDGDADLDGHDFADFDVPPCDRCGGTWKPDVVFFGGNVPAERVESAYARIREADLVLAVGTSLMVFSGYRFVKAAREQGTPIAIVSLGKTRGDDEATWKVEEACGPWLTRLADRLDACSKAPTRR